MKPNKSEETALEVGINKPDTIFKHHQDKLYQFIPQSKIKQLHRIDSGQFSTIYEINGEVIVRIPKFQISLAEFKREILFLTDFGSICPLPVPQILYANTESFEEALMAYSRIPGIPLLPSIFKELPLTTKQKIAGQLAEFCVFLHQLNPSDSTSTYQIEDDFKYWAEFFERTKKLLIPHMRADAKEDVVHRFEAYLSWLKNTPYSTCIRHGDLGPTNILWDAETGQISGVIDFSSIAIGDPAADLASLSCLGPDFPDHLFTSYPINEIMLRRMHFIRWTFALQEALSGAENNDPQSFKDGMVSYI